MLCHFGFSNPKGQTRVSCFGASRHFVVPQKRPKAEPNEKLSEASGYLPEITVNIARGRTHTHAHREPKRGLKFVLGVPNLRTLKPNLLSTALHTEQKVRGSRNSCCSHVLFSKDKIDFFYIEHRLLAHFS